MNTEKETTKKSKFAIFSVMARLLYVLWHLIAGLILFLEAISLIWIPYWLFTGEWIFEPTLNWIWKVDKHVNVP